GCHAFGLEQIARCELFQLMDFIFVAMVAGEHIIDDGGAIAAKSALTVFAESNGGGGGMIVAVHGFLE
ncbi:MAG TPA: hypothetical protein VFI68_13215, partial [Anaerolineales bacterium]|nr:hypothetical protein [Anaerolineales bacterium]